MFEFLRPKLKIAGGPTYGLGPIVDTWGAARLIYEKVYTYPLDSPFGAGIPTVRPWRITQPPPPFVMQGVFISGISGVVVGSFYSTPVSPKDRPGEFSS